METCMSMNISHQPAQATSGRTHRPEASMSRGRNSSTGSSGRTTGVPVILLNHLAAELDRCDPRIVDGIAATRRVIAFNYRGVGASEGKTPLIGGRDGAGRDRRSSVRWASTRSICSASRLAASSRRTSRRKSRDLVRKVILAGTGPAGGRGHRKGRPRCPGRSSSRAMLTFRDPEYYLFFTSDPRMAAAPRRTSWSG